MATTTTRAKSKKPTSKRRPSKRAGAAKAAQQSPDREAIIAAVDAVTSLEVRIETAVSEARSVLTVGCERGAVASGGFASVEDLLASVCDLRWLEPMLAGEVWPPIAPSFVFATYMDLIEDIRRLEHELDAAVVQARETLAQLEDGMYRQAGYRSYEELLERALCSLPRLSQVLVLDDARASKPPAARRTAKVDTHDADEQFESVSIDDYVISGGAPIPPPLPATAVQPPQPAQQPRAVPPRRATLARSRMAMRALTVAATFLVLTVLLASSRSRIRAATLSAAPHASSSSVVGR